MGRGEGLVPSFDRGLRLAQYVCLPLIPRQHCFLSRGRSAPEAAKYLYLLFLDPVSLGHCEGRQLHLIVNS